MGSGKQVICSTRCAFLCMNCCNLTLTDWSPGTSKSGKIRDSQLCSTTCRHRPWALHTCDAGKHSASTEGHGVRLHQQPHLRCGKPRWWACNSTHTDEQFTHCSGCLAVCGGLVSKPRLPHVGLTFSPDFIVLAFGRQCAIVCHAPVRYWWVQVLTGATQ